MATGERLARMIVPSRFADKITVVTGGTSGIGAAIARWLLAKGALEDIASPSLYLASDDAAYITGTSLVVDGGWEITNDPDLSKYMS